MKKRLLAGMLSLALCLSVYCVTASAEELEIGSSEEIELEPSEEIGVDISEEIESEPSEEIGVDISEEVELEPSEEIELDSSEEIELEAMEDESTLASGNYGENCEYQLLETENGFTLRIFGTGSASSGIWKDEQLSSLKKRIKTIILEEGITSIGYEAFKNCINLCSVQLPATLTTIDECAFENCFNLSEVNFPDSIRYIEALAFAYCENLKVLELPSSLRSIGWKTFYHCSSLSSIELPDSIGWIEPYAFALCNSLTSIDLPQSLKEVPAKCFAYCSNLSTVNISDSITEIGRFAFLECSSLKKIRVPESVTNISWSAFYNCKNLVLYGEPGSYAESFAIAQGVPFGYYQVVINEQPAFQSITSLGEDVVFSVQAENVDTYQWFYSKDSGENWYKCTTEGATTDCLAVKASSGNVSRLYRCKLTAGGHKPVFTEAVGFTGIIRQPVDIKATLNSRATFSVDTVNTVSCQWYYSKDGIKWYKSTLSGSDSETLTFKVSSVNAKNSYRCVVTCQNGEKVTSKQVGTVLIR